MLPGAAWCRLMLTVMEPVVATRGKMNMKYNAMTDEMSPVANTSKMGPMSLRVQSKQKPRITCIRVRRPRGSDSDGTRDKRVKQPPPFGPTCQQQALNSTKHHHRVIHPHHGSRIQHSGRAWNRIPYNLLSLSKGLER